LASFFWEANQLLAWQRFFSKINKDRLAAGFSYQNENKPGMPV